VHLTERFTGREVFLVGTANASTMLAQRTQKLIKEVKPEAVLVQTSQEWWNTTKLLQYVNSQQEFNHYQKHLSRYQWDKSFNLWKNNFRSYIFWPRFYLYSALF
jgi:predicted SAM-dependent methyltransferase